MRKRWIKRIMAGGMLLAIYLLSREGAVLAGKTQGPDPGSDRYRQRPRRNRSGGCGN